MSIPGSASPLLLASTAAAAGGYQISRSLRFNSADSAYLSRTPAVAGNRRTWTWAGWVKRSSLVDSNIFSAGTSDTNRSIIGFLGSNDGKLYVLNNVSGSGYNSHVSAAVFRDVSAWYHFVIAADTAQVVAADRFKFYVNGVLQTWETTANPQNTDTLFNTTSGHTVGSNPPYAASSFFDGYLADIHFIDGQALTPSSFTEVSATTGQLIPKAYSGTYGTNGFQLKFADNSSNTATTLGKDTSGNSNNWTPNNLSVTAGAGNDSLVDTPTSIAATDTGVGGEIRGNYATLNPLSTTTGTYTQGNLRYEGANSTKRSNGTLAVSTGKWYWEVTLGNAPYTPRAGAPNDTYYNAFGFGISSSFNSTLSYRTSTDSLALGDNGFYKNFTGSETDVGTAFSSGDVLSIAVDLDINTFTFRRNNTQIATGTIGGTAGRELVPIIISYSGQYGVMDCNFGQRAFSYTAPTNFKALCDTNLPAPLTAKPNTLFDALIWSGDSVNNRKLTTNFGPDLFWAKQRNGVAYHSLNDSVRGPNAILQSNTTSAEQVNSNGYVITFASDGVNVTNGSDINASGSTYVAWAWDAGTTTASNGSGSITSQVRANVSAGFSVVTYTGNGTDGATVGHGLGLTPGMIIVKIRESSNGYDHGWIVAHSGLTNYNSLWLNETGAANAGPGRGWINPYGSSTFTLKAGNGGTSLFDNVNQNGKTYVAYCFAPVAGFSSFGSYVGNGSSDGPFVFTGMRPRWVMVKSTTITSNWMILDTARDTYNVASKELGANRAEEENNAEQFAGNTDINSNGFKLRSSNTEVNQSAATYIYAAFAENPFQYARAR